MIVDGGVNTTQEGNLSFYSGRRKLARSSGLLLCAVLSACEPQTGARKPDHRSVVADIIVTVINRSGRGVQVSLESDTLGYVLGKVMSRASRSFSLPSRLGGSPSVLHLTAIHDGGSRVRSEAFQVHRGEKVVWTFGDEGRGTVEKQ